LEQAACSHAAVQNERFAEECICFPEDEPPKFAWRAEADIAAAATCPLHGQRFSRVADIIHVYRPRWFRERNPNFEETSEDGLFFGSPQYVKAMRASLPPSQWPVNDERYEFSPERKVFLVLRDGTEIDSGKNFRGLATRKNRNPKVSTIRKQSGTLRGTEGVPRFVEAKHNSCNSLVLVAVATVEERGFEAPQEANSRRQEHLAHPWTTLGIGEMFLVLV
jgi:hypothetical protein